MAKRRGKLASQAALQALVRFGPELSGLKELQRTAEDQFAQSVRQAHGGAAGIINVIDSTRPQVAGIYDRATAGAGQTGTLISHDLQGLGPVADSIKAAASTEAGHQVGNLQAAQAAALTELGTRRVQAREGEQFAVQSAQGQLAKDLTKILQRRQDLSREKGAFTAATIGDLTAAAEKHASDVAQKSAGRAQTERDSVRSSGIDPDTGKPIPGGRLDPKAKQPSRSKATADAFEAKYGVKPRSTGEHATVASQIRTALADAQDLKSKGRHTRSYTGRVLTHGRAAMTLKVDEHGKPLPQPLPLVAVKQRDPLIASVALDLAYDGHVSGKNATALHNAGLSVTALGLPGETPKRRRASRGAQAVSSVARS